MNLKKGTWRPACACLSLVVTIPANAQKPEIFDVSNVVVGTQRVPTLYLYAAGKWSDAGKHVGPLSTEIHCYKGLGFCEMANATQMDGEAQVALETFDILRWDSNEIIAVDSSPICIVNTLRVDLVTKRVTLSSSDKGVSKGPFCKGVEKLSTAVLWGRDDYVKDEINKARKK